MCASAPLPTLPIPRGVRQASIIKASGMVIPNERCGIIVRLAIQVDYSLKQIHWIGVPVPEDEAITSAAMNVRDAVLSRHSCRSFIQRPVDAATLHDLLDTARFAPSGGNLQPWLVHVLTGDSMVQFRTEVTPKLQAEPLGGTA